MTPIDLRIKYKSKTGYSPIYGKDDHEHYNYQGELTPDYVEWLGGSSTRKLIAYKQDTGLYSHWYDNKRNIFFTDEYSEWVEENYCKACNILEELEIPWA